MTNGVQLLGCSCAESTRVSTTQQAGDGSVQSGSLGTTSVETSSIGVSTSVSTLEPNHADSVTVSDGSGSVHRDSLVQNNIHLHCICCSRLAPHAVNNYWPFHHCTAHHPLITRYVNVHHFHQHFHGEPSVTYPMSNSGYVGLPPSDPLQGLRGGFTFNGAVFRPLQMMPSLIDSSFLSRDARHAFQPQSRLSSATPPSSNEYSSSARAITTSQPVIPLLSPHSPVDPVEQSSRVSGVIDQTGGATVVQSNRMGDGSSGSSEQSGNSFLEGFVFLSDSSDDDDPLVPYETYISALIHSPVPLWQQRQLEGQQGHLERRRRVESQWFNYREQMDAPAGFPIPPISFDRRVGQHLSQPVASSPETSHYVTSCSGDRDSASDSSGEYATRLRSSRRREATPINYQMPAFMEHLVPTTSIVDPQDVSQTTQNRSNDEPIQESRRRSLNDSTETRSLYTQTSPFFGPFVLLDRQSWPMEAQLLRHMAQILETPEGATMSVIERNTVCSRFVPSSPLPDGEEDKCSICLLEFERDDSIRTLRCNHFFHVRCIDRWLVINKKCPVCRLEVDHV
ncbi:E3 ubiquitin-protein ligase Arkadia [Trichuris trichiura]|uniref:RING-type E3 ubiquitin transferase n=1 Tax=Trichuris trichiura TaxID=36087 RepID=A0A077Z792_TRITR|nr:E3 ubiquitin-protein ligase Arkadia [Trichuris trichiura]